MIHWVSKKRCIEKNK